MQQVLRIGDEVRIGERLLERSIGAKLYRSKGEVSVIRGFETSDGGWWDQIGTIIPPLCIVCITNGVRISGITGNWFSYTKGDSYRIHSQDIELAGAYSDGLENWV